MTACILEDALGKLTRYEPDGFGAWEMTDLATGTRLMLVPEETVALAKAQAVRVFEEVRR